MNANSRECREDIIYKDEVYEIIGTAFEVLNNLGCGFLEAVYQEAMEIEFRNKNIPFEREKPLRIKYKETFLKKEYFSDFLCYEKIKLNSRLLIELLLWRNLKF
jgi:GxxExxY protein